MTRALAFAFALAACGSGSETSRGASPGPAEAAPACPVVSAEQPLPMRSVRVAPAALPPATMTYVDTGSGSATFVLLHGIPTSSYEWRNVIPELARLGRVVVPDLVGFGTSDRPEIAYSLDQHVAYLGAFLDELALGDVILVVHDLGSLTGLIWGARHPARVRGLVSIEGLIPDTIPASVSQSPSKCTANPPDHPSCFWMFLRSPAGQAAIVDSNLFIEGALAGEPCPPSAEALDVYRAAFPTRESRLHLATYPGSVPVDGSPATLVPELEAYSRWLESSEMPKLVLYGDPGFLAPEKVARRAARRWKSTDAAPVGRGAHFLPEIQPTAVGQAIRRWYEKRFERDGRP